MENPNKGRDESEEAVDSLESRESLETSYIQFMASIPRLCSPTICGTINYKTPNRQKWQSVTPLDQSYNSYKPFEWSIDQKAVLDPIDFSNAEDMDIYKEIDERVVSKQLDAENELFFSQKQIIPSPKTPERSAEKRDPMQQMYDQSMEDISNRWPNDRTPDYQNSNRSDISNDCFQTPLNCSKSRQKKKLFKDDHYLRESAVTSITGKRSAKDSAFETIDSQNLLSPIYSPDWRNTSLSKRITHLSPICSRINDNYVDLDFGLDPEDNDLNDKSMRTHIASYSNLTFDMMSIESIESPNKQKTSPLYCCPNTNTENTKVLREYNGCEQRVFQRFFTKTSTPSHI